MDILITHGNMARTRSMHVRPIQLWLTGTVVLVLLMLLSGTIYHVIFLKAAREGWPVVSHLVRLVVRDEFEQRDRFMRENLDAMAQKVGEMQAKVIKLEAVGSRVSGLAGIKAEELRALDAAGSPASAPAKPAAGAAGAGGGGRGGPFVPASTPSIEQLNEVLAQLDVQTDHGSDVFTLVESRLLEKRLEMMMVPSIAPVAGGVGSGFGFRVDPFNGRAALHTGLDYPAPVGTPIRAAAAGVVRSAEPDGAYGLSLELDHGNGLVTRYAHNSRILVKPGELVRRGQDIAMVGNTGRSTGPHLHFEVLLGGVPQNPARFLARGEGLDAAEKTAAATQSRGKARRGR
ncbi:M23 family metallopeptidase [Sphaerotilus microaerophilus]|uniref:Peptidase M23 n=1 Tax=Sphaerotilus microaerophilus TaxID=2914710 RepID=A0ABM7YTP5_9BURK|nr:M23 family metallopeptidase [Sphaerotilus sp. FB-5]BDI07998.1 peptidase M23 [Sphaerotilus sp. FB-5]